VLGTRCWRHSPKMPENQLPKVEIQQSGLRTHIATTESGLSLVGWGARMRGIYLASLSSLPQD
jgi:hypothetical protein